ncbi:hypothetical protein [Paenibacillus sp. GP183]|jgi:hypothetical protein|uniref:hypothetical protein n=1 Tax=Paenibacillus sp. GP183 TaxID=1882751 RepID=UPI0008991A27|nr:hypothetical protein [Paenibacillus sp. GP183]SED11835.1 hypothetical protein SAMN05443246_5786 [Paenibacillus sp. GP183]
MQIRIFSLLLLLSLNMFTANLVYAKDASAEKLVTSYIKSINEKNWSDIPGLWVKGQRDELIDFFNNKQNKKQMVGIFNIKKAHLVASKQIPYEYGQIYLPSRYIESFNAPQIFYVAVDFKVYKEDKYHINGVNYFFIVTAIEDGKRKIVLTPLVPVKSLISDGYGFGTLDEKTFDERRLKFVQ